MKKKLFQIKQYLLHFMSSKNNYGHGIHSPYVYQFVQSTFHCEHNYYCFSKIENIRKQNLSNQLRISITDYGTKKNRQNTVAQIAKSSVQSKKNAQLLFKIANHIKAQYILELGTSLGISTAYLAAHNSHCTCISLEGSDEIAAIAQENHDMLQLKNIEIIVGNIDNTLAPTVEKMQQIDLAYIDANHHYKACTEYFEQILNKTHENSVVIIDDIHWSHEMKTAWNKIKENPKTCCTINTYNLGIVFFKPFLHNETFKIDF